MGALVKEGEGFSRDDVPGCELEREAMRIRPPRRSEDFLAPVNEVSFDLGMGEGVMGWDGLMRVMVDD